MLLEKQWPQKPSTGKTTISIRSSGLPLPHTACCFSSTAPLDHLHFNFMYHFENEATNRLVYLFTLDLDDDSILCNKNFKGGKLWTFQQMEHNLGRNFFSSCLEYEFEHLEAIIYTREKYKES